MDVTIAAGSVSVMVTLKALEGPRLFTTIRYSIGEPATTVLGPDLATDRSVPERTVVVSTSVLLKGLTSGEVLVTVTVLVSTVKSGSRELTLTMISMICDWPAGSTGIVQVSLPAGASVQLKPRVAWTKVVLMGSESVTMTLKALDGPSLLTSS